LTYKAESQSSKNINFLPSLVEIGQVVLEKSFKGKVDTGQTKKTDGRTTDAVTWHKLRRLMAR